MANGRSGDNEITDILTHGRTVFGSSVDQAVIALVRDFPQVRKELADFVASATFAVLAGDARAQRRAMREKVGDIRARENGQTERRDAFKKLRRPIPVWIITLLLAYTILGTVLNLGNAFGGEQSFDLGVIFLGIVSAVVSGWLIGQIWSDGPRQVPLAWALVAITALIYLYAMILFEPEVGGAVSVRSQYIAAGIFGVLMVGLHMLIPWYLARRKKAGEKMS